MIYPIRRLVGRSNNVYRYYIHRGFHSSLPSYAKKLERFKLADIGEGITECEIIKWYVRFFSGYGSRIDELRVYLPGL